MPTMVASDFFAVWQASCLSTQTELARAEARPLNPPGKDEPCLKTR